MSTFGFEEGVRRAGLRGGGPVIGLMLALVSITGRAEAQTDYYNTDAGRPVRVEDASAIERYAFELQAAPLRFERSDDGALEWAIEPELAYGLLPRTQVEVALPLALRGGSGFAEKIGLGGVELAVLHNLNAETGSYPALAIAADVVLPVGEFAPPRAYATLKGIATRTFRFARVHVNGQVTPGPTPETGPLLHPPGQSGGASPEPAADGNESGLSRWMAGLAVDRAFPLRSALLVADVFVEQPLVENSDPRWTAEAGLRYQLSPFFSLDAGVGRRLSGGDEGWFVTLGAARSFAVRSLISMPPQ